MTIWFMPRTKSSRTSEEGVSPRGVTKIAKSKNSSVNQGTGRILAIQPETNGNLRPFRDDFP